MDLAFQSAETSSIFCWTAAYRANSLRLLRRDAADAVLAVDQDDQEESGVRPARETQESKYGHFGRSEASSGGEVHVDYRFPGEENKDFKLTIMVARDRGTQMAMSSVASSKNCGDFVAQGWSRS